MISARPCRICRTWFQPHPRAGKRQKVCSDPACQRERHRRSCASWRQRNPDYDRETRLRNKMTVEPEAAARAGARPDAARARPDATPATSPAGKIEPPVGQGVRIDWNGARDVVGLEVLVFMEEFSEVLLERTRDVVKRHMAEIMKEFVRYRRDGARDEIGNDPGGGVLKERWRR